MATGDEAAIEEERRLLYVAMTRARRPALVLPARALPHRARPSAVERSPRVRPAQPVPHRRGGRDDGPRRRSPNGASTTVSRRRGAPAAHLTASPWPSRRPHWCSSLLDPERRRAPHERTLARQHEVLDVVQVRHLADPVALRIEHTDLRADVAARIEADHLDMTAALRTTPGVRRHRPIPRSSTRRPADRRRGHRSPDATQRASCGES